MPAAYIPELECVAGLHTKCRRWNSNWFKKFFHSTICSCACHNDKENFVMLKLAEDDLDFTTEISKVFGKNKPACYPFNKQGDDQSWMNHEIATISDSFKANRSQNS